MEFNIETVKTANNNEYFGYKEDISTGKRTYLCHAFTSEHCNQMLDKIKEGK